MAKHSSGVKILKEDPEAPLPNLNGKVSFGGDLTATVDVARLLPLEKEGLRSEVLRRLTYHVTKGSGKQIKISRLTVARLPARRHLEVHGTWHLARFLGIIPGLLQTRSCFDSLR